jgi:hypothetical protein
VYLRIDSRYVSPGLTVESDSYVDTDDELKADAISSNNDIVYDTIANPKNPPRVVKS